MRVEVEQSYASEGPDLVVEGQPERVLRFRGGRILFDGDKVSKFMLFFMDPPDFPIEELVGKRLIGKPKRLDSDQIQ